MKIDFYVLETSSQQRSLFFACQLVEKLYAESEAAPARSIHIHTDTPELAERFDALLWTYRDDSFLPHALYQPDQPGKTLPAITIGHAEAPPATESAILINLSQATPPAHTTYSHLIEIVFNEATVQQSARDRYKQYRQQGDDINTIKLKENAS